MGTKKPRTSILMDTREPESLRYLMQKTFGDRLEVCKLDQADYVLTDVDGCCLGIERKRITDFLQSLKTGRLYRQMDRVTTAYLPCLIIEGTARSVPSATGAYRMLVSNAPGAWSLGALQMAIWSMQERGVRVIWTFGHDETVDTLRVLLARADKRCVIGPGLESESLSFSGFSGGD